MPTPCLGWRVLPRLFLLFGWVRGKESAHKLVCALRRKPKVAPRWLLSLAPERPSISK